MATEARQLQFVDEEVAAERLNLTERVLRNLRRRGDGPPFYRFGKTGGQDVIKYDLDELQEWIRQQRVEGGKGESGTERMEAVAS